MKCYFAGIIALMILNSVAHLQFFQINNDLLRRQFLVIRIDQFRDQPLNHCVKSVRIRSYSGPHFPIFGLNSERYSVSLVFSPNTGKCRPE